MTRLPAHIDPATAAGLLADWGFLVDPDLPDTPGPAYLLVAMRSTPTLRHYDPEAISYWVNDEHRRGTRTSVTYATRLPLEQDYTWGPISIIDRLGVTNEYLTFGGHLSAQRIDDAAVYVFSSPAPLLRRGGHSQGWDQAAQNVGGFLGRVRAAAGYARPFEIRAADIDPLTRYAAFVREQMVRYRRSAYLRDRYPALWSLMVAEERRLMRDHPAEWSAGEHLLDAVAEASHLERVGG